MITANIVAMVKDGIASPSVVRIVMILTKVSPREWDSTRTIEPSARAIGSSFSARASARSATPETTSATVRDRNDASTPPVQVDSASWRVIPMAPTSTSVRAHQIVKLNMAGACHSRPIEDGKTRGSS